MKKKIRGITKNFFNIPTEDMIEEESSKIFEKIPLITLTRNKIFLAITLFLIIVNFLVGFEVNFLYLRQILGFLFLIFIPGLLIMLCFKIRTLKFWEFLVYTIGLSIAFIMFTGLVVNWTLPALNLTDKPLSLYPILCCFDIFLVVLGIVAWFRNKYLDPIKVTVPKLDALNSIFFIIPMTFPVLAILGAFLLNNHGTNILTMIMLGGIAIYVLLLTIFRKRLNENIWPWAIWMISLALVWMTSMRGWGIPSHDILFESKIFELTNQNSYWDINSFPNAYNSCLSLNILPQIFYLFNNFSENFLFKFVLVFGTSLIPLICLIFFNLLFKKKIIGFFSSFFMITNIVFMLELPMEIRQSFALIFFGLFLITLYLETIPFRIKKILIIFFGISIIVSHYSTAYIFLSIISLTYFGNLIYKQFKKREIIKELDLKPQNYKFPLTGVFVLLLLLFGFLWYSQITPTSTGIVDTMSKTLLNLNNIFSDELKQQDTSLTKQINIFYQPENLTKTLIKYQEESNLNGSYNLNYPINLVYPKILTPLINTNFSKILSFINNFITLIFKGLIFLGVFLMFIYKKRFKINTPFLLMAIISIILLLLIIMLPFLSSSYSTARFFIQTLFILSPCAFIINLLTKENTSSKLIYFFSLILIFTFLFNAGFITQIFGGDYPVYNLNNGGNLYDELYFFKSDDLSLIWILSGHNQVNADNSLKTRLAIKGYQYNLISDDVLPSMVETESYVIEGYTNNLMGRTFKIFNNRLIFFNFPEEFFNKNKNEIYNNGDSNIFK
jgi:uncharacterized membrane protein